MPNKGRPRTSLASNLPRDRLPAGTIPLASSSNFASHNHINVVSRYLDTCSDDEEATDNSERPVHTNPSYLTETDLGRDLHRQSSQPDIDRRNATFADMARAGIGGSQPFRPDHMASHEPVPLTHYMKFKKRTRGKNTHSPVNEEIFSEAGPSTTTQQYCNQEYSSSTVKHAMLYTANAMQQGQHPIDLLGQHFAIIRQTFGHDLPPPGMLNSVVGEREGELYFAADGGGDITAYAWNANSMEWRIVGLYSYRHQQIEGALGVRQLKGQKIGGALPRNPVEHFYAIAKQFEDESPLAALSPTTIASGSSRMRQQPRASTVQPVVSPRPLRPSAAFKVDGDFSGTMRTVDHGLQQATSPALGAFVGASKPTATSQRSLSNLGTDYVSATDLPPPSISMHESHDSSPARTRNQSRTSHRHLDLSTAATSFDQHGTASDKSNVFCLAQYDAATTADQHLQYKVWKEEQVRKQERSCVEASREPIYDDVQPHTQPIHEPYLAYGVPRSATAYTCGNIFNPGGADHENDQMVNTGRRDTPVVVPFRFASPRRLGMSEEHFNGSNHPWLSGARNETVNIRPIESTNRKPSANCTPVPIQRPTRAAEGPIEYKSIAEIGDSIPDTTLESRRPIFQAPARAKGPSTLNGRTEKEMDEDEKSLPDMSIRHRGKFFDTVEDGVDPLYGKYRLTSHEMYLDTFDRITRRTGELRQKARNLRDKNGVPLSSEKVDEIARDPVTHIMDAVNSNIKAYQSANSKKGDFLHSQWSEPDPKLIDMAANERGEKKSSYFGGAEPSSDEIVFKGRGSSRPTLVPTIASPKPAAAKVTTAAGFAGNSQMSSQVSAAPYNYGREAMHSQAASIPAVTPSFRFGQAAAERSAASRRADFDVSQFRAQGFGGHEGRRWR